MEQNGKELLGLTASELAVFMTKLGEKPYRGHQIYHSLYRECQFDLSTITELPKVLRKKLANNKISIPKLDSKQIASDATEKFLLQLEDGEKIECVLIPEQNRQTLCISTQVGCSLNCQFCLTADIGFRRNLSSAEIVGQVLYVLSHKRLKIKSAGPTLHPTLSNIVFMGMGEPLQNLENVMKSLIILSDPEGMRMSPNKITLSTVGLVPQIKKLARCPVIPNLAISLSATTNIVRNQIIPINRKYPIEQLLQACIEFPLKARQRITFEYVLIDGVNDSDDDARRLIKLLAKIKAKVNLLSLNKGKSGDLKSSSNDRMQCFQGILVEKGVPTYIRRPRGADIFAACGQLHLARLKTLPPPPHP